MKMTKEQTERFRMLIGDDSYTTLRTAEDNLLCMFSVMQRTLGVKGPFIDERIVDGWYRTSSFPIPQFSGADIRVVDNVEDMIREGNSGQYHWIVSDLEYGRDRVEGGLEVFEGINKTGLVKAIFTSSGDKNNLKRLQLQSKADYFIAPALSEDSGSDKVNMLAETIVKHYQINELNGGK